jgi:hypothetical protein
VDGLGAGQSLATNAAGLAAAFAAFVNDHLSEPAAANGPAHVARCGLTSRVGLCLPESACQSYDDAANPAAKSMPDTLPTHAVHVAANGTITKRQLSCGCLLCVRANAPAPTLAAPGPADIAPPCPNAEYCGPWRSFSEKYGGGRSAGGRRVEKAQLKLARAAWEGARAGGVLGPVELEVAELGLGVGAWVAVRSDLPGAEYALLQLTKAPAVSGKKRGRRPNIGGVPSDAEPAGRGGL